MTKETDMLLKVAVIRKCLNYACYSNVMHTKAVIKMIHVPVLPIEFHTYCCNASNLVTAKCKHEKLIFVVP